MIGATALFKVSHLLSQWPQAARYAEQLHQLAYLGWGGHPGSGLRGLRYLMFFLPVMRDDLTGAARTPLGHKVFLSPLSSTPPVRVCRS